MRKFKVILTQDNKSGPFDILYNINDNIYTADLFSSGLPAENITSSSLGNGVDVFIPFSSTVILVKNKKETCDIVQEIILSPINVPDIPLVIYPIYTPPIPTRTLRPIPTPNPTFPVFSSYEFRVTSANSLDTVCSDIAFNVIIYGNNPSFIDNLFFYNNLSLSSKFNGNGFLYKLINSSLYVGIKSNGSVYSDGDCIIIPPNVVRLKDVNYYGPCNTNEPFVTYYLQQGDTLLTIDGSDGHTIYQDSALTTQIPFGVYTDGINKFQLYEGENYDNWVLIGLCPSIPTPTPTPTSTGPTPTLTPTPTPTPTPTRSPIYYYIVRDVNSSNNCEQTNPVNYQSSVLYNVNRYVTINGGGVVKWIEMDNAFTGGSIINSLSPASCNGSTSTPTLTPTSTPTPTPTQIMYTYLARCSGGNIVGWITGNYASNLQVTIASVCYVTATSTIDPYIGDPIIGTPTWGTCCPTPTPTPTPAPVGYGIYTGATFSNATLACADNNYPSEILYITNGDIISNGDVLYTNTELTVNFIGNNQYYHIYKDNNRWAATLSNLGIVSNLTNCTINPTQTPTPTPTPTLISTEPSIVQLKSNSDYSCTTNESFMTYYLKPGDTLLTIDGSDGHTVYQDYALTTEIPFGIYTDGIYSYQLSEGGDYNNWVVMSLCSTLTTCITYTNNSNSVINGVDFTTCGGYVLTNQSIDIDESICVKNNRINENGRIYLTEGNPCD